MPGHSKTKARCGAHARSTGQPCKAMALKNGRCRNHGGKSTGPRTDEGRRKALANLPQYKGRPELIARAIADRDARRAAEQSATSLCEKLGRPVRTPDAGTALVENFLKESAEEQRRHDELAERLSRARDRDIQ